MADTWSNIDHVEKMGHYTWKQKQKNKQKTKRGLLLKQICGRIKTPIVSKSKNYTDRTYWRLPKPKNP